MSHISKIFLLLFICGSLNLLAQSSSENAWKKNDFSIFQVSKATLAPSKFLVYQLDLSEIKNQLTNAPLRFDKLTRNIKPIISIPNPTGHFDQYEIVENSNFHPRLAAKYSEIKSYLGVCITDPSKIIRFDISPYGFHGMILVDGGNSFFIDPYTKGDKSNYIVYFKKDLEKSNNYECLTNHESVQKEIQNARLRAGDCNLRTYKLALSCTGEYANYHGGTKVSVLAAMNTSMTRVNGIYEKEVGIKMELVANNDDLIFLDSSTDPFSNSNANALINENQTVCDSVIGLQNYDIGHVFSTGGGGLASISSVCSSSRKAKGVTGSPSPTGDPFDIDYVCHEMGHQFGALHTFNNSCSNNRANSSSFEPGSGSTIMAYAGICPPNVQNHSDAYFHSHSIIQIKNFVASTNCSVETNPGNTSPVLNSLSNYTIPNSTPFELIANASDNEGDPLTYCWEQIDKEIATMAPQGSSVDGPLFRSLEPNISPTRSFPKLSSVLSNSTSTWEVLPTVARTMHFRCMVRDNHAGIGCTAEQEMTITVSNNSTPFQITSLNTNETWFGLDTKEITWDVASTDQAPVNASTVDIFLSTDGGQTFPIVLSSAETNDGSAMITIPNNISSTTCRIKIKGTNNIFFDINNIDFTIENAVVPTFLVEATPTTQSICTNTTNSTSFQLDFMSVLNFNENISLSLMGLPVNAGHSFSTNNFSPTNSSILTITNLDQVVPGNYTLIVNANSTSVQKTIILELEVLAASLNIGTLISPSNGTNLNGAITLSWNTIPNAKEYEIEISTNPSFPGNNTTTFVETNTSLNLNSLNAATAYYWRIRGGNYCVFSNYSETRSFQTGEITCSTFNSTNIPLNIPSGITTSSTLSINDDLSIYDLNVSMDISHSWVGDLSGTLKGPNNIEITLFDQPGIPASENGCGQNNLKVTFDDEAINTAIQFEGTCASNSNYAIEGDFQTLLGPLSSFDNLSSQGNWTLDISDQIDPDEGTLNSWSLEVCYLGAISSSISLINNQSLSIGVNQTKAIQNVLLKTTSTGVLANNISYVITKTPIKGNLILNGMALQLGDVFTQSEIDNGSLSYSNTTIGTSDSFKFDVKDNLVGWIGNNTFNINILANSLNATANIDNQILCNGDANGSISIQASGGTTPYQYSQDGISFQVSNIFSGLMAGNFQFTIKDANNFTTTISQSLSEPAILTIDYTLDGNIATITSTGGITPYTYSVDNQNFQSNNIFTLANGTTTIYVKDANDCTASTVVVVSVNNINLEYSTTPISCFNGNDGSISITATGGSSPYQYSIDNGMNYQASNIFSNLSAGNYSIIVKDADDFLKQLNNIDLANPAAIAINVNINENDITITPVGNYTYALDNQNFQSTNTFTNLVNGNHTAYIKDANGCQNESSFNISVNDIVLSFTKTDVMCFGDQTGEIIAIAQGNGVLTYSLNSGTPQTNNIFSNLSAGQYILKVTDELNFTKEIEITITSPTELVFTTQINNSTVSIIASGGTPDYSYSIDGIVGFQNNSTIMNVPVGVHTVKVKDTNGCETDGTIEIFGSISATVDSKNITCNGGDDGEIVISPSGGVAPYQYSLNQGTFTTNNTFSDLEAGVFSVLIKDANGTEYSFNVTLTEPDPIAFNASSIYDKIVIENINNQFFEFSLDGNNWQSSNEFLSKSVGNYDLYAKLNNGCIATKSYFHNFELLGGTANQIISCESFKGIEIVPKGGLSPYTYSIDGENYQSSQTFIDIESSGKVDFYIQDVLGHIFHGQITLTVVELLDLEVSSISNSIEIFATGGTLPYEYSVDGENWQSENIFSNLSSNTYTVIVRDQDGCTKTYVITIVANTDIIPIESLSVTPNPNSGNFILHLSDDIDNTFSVFIFNIVGQKVFQKEYFKKDIGLNIPIDLESKSGIYQIMVKSGEKNGAIRILITD